MAVSFDKAIDPDFEQTQILSKIFADVDMHSLWNDLLKTNEHVIFFYKTIIRAIDACLSGEYTQFDAHTTSNCCHGMAVLAKLLIIQNQNLNLKKIQKEAEQRITIREQQMEKNIDAGIHWLPWQTIALASLYILTYVSEIDPEKGRRTRFLKLMEISGVSARFSKKVSSALQKVLSNIVAYSYQSYFGSIDNGSTISGVPISLWGKYVQDSSLREDNKGVKYAPCLYSMQVLLSFLIKSRASIAILNDIVDFSGKQKERYIRLFEGDGNSQFLELSSNHISLLEPYDGFTPVIVFGGCVFSDEMDTTVLEKSMAKWFPCLPNLILGCDVYYPQFPKVQDDPNFNSSPIIPSEKLLQEKIHESSKIQGLSANDPSLFCLTHIYPASLGQILKVKENPVMLPFSSEYLPSRLMTSNFFQKMALASSK